MIESTMRLGELCDLVTDQANPLDRPDSVYVGLEHVESGKFIRSGEGTASNVRSAKYAFVSGDILYGKLRPYLDKAVLAQDDGICTTELLVLRPRIGIDPRFVVGVMHTSTFVEYAIAGTTGVQHPRKSWNHISNFQLPAISTEEQKQVADFLWYVQDAITANAEVSVLLEKLFKALLHKLMTREVTLSNLRLSTTAVTDVSAARRKW